jgi:hypothetical protein
VDLGARFPRTAVALACVAALTSCTQNEPEKPTLTEATQQLVSDGDKLLTSAELQASGSAQATERADSDQVGSCLPGKIQRFFRAEGNFSGSVDQQSPHNTVGLMRTALVAMGYEQLWDNLDVRDPDMAVVVAKKAKSGSMYMLIARTAQKPNILIIGKTECYEQGG